jgi:hypothetical protein
MGVHPIRTLGGVTVALPTVLGGSLSLSGMLYSDLQAARLKKDEDIPVGATEVDIGETCDRAARWWAVILAPGEGWRITLDLGDKLYPVTIVRLRSKFEALKDILILLSSTAIPTRSSSSRSFISTRRPSIALTASSIR